jgi:hypothetical protein
MAVQPRGRLSSFFSLPAAKLPTESPAALELRSFVAGADTATPSRTMAMPMAGTPMAMTPQARYGGAVAPPSLPRLGRSGGRPSLAMSPFTLRRASGVSQVRCHLLPPPPPACCPASSMLRRKNGAVRGLDYLHFALPSTSYAFNLLHSQLTPPFVLYMEHSVRLTKHRFGDRSVGGVCHIR